MKTRFAALAREIGVALDNHLQRPGLDEGSYLLSGWYVAYSDRFSGEDFQIKVPP
jgi:hypothetical protein